MTDLNQPMRVFVFTYDRFDSITTPAYFDASGVAHTTLCHSEEAKRSFAAAGHVRDADLVATGNPKGLGYQRNSALEMMADGEWALFMVDDLKSVTEIEDYEGRANREELALGITMDNQKSFRGVFDHEIDAVTFMQRAAEVARRCERIGAHLGGFAGIGNPPYRDRKWKHNIVADGRAIVVQKTKLRFDLNAQLIDDVSFTCQNIERFGLMTVNQWVLPDCRRYTAGAFGSLEERRPQKLREAAYLAQRYPDLVAIRPKKGHAPGSHVVLTRRLPADLRQALESLP